MMNPGWHPIHPLKMHEDRGTHFDISLSDRLTLLVTLKVFLNLFYLFYLFFFFFSFFCLPSYRFLYFNLFFSLLWHLFRHCQVFTLLWQVFRHFRVSWILAHMLLITLSFFYVFFHLVESSMIVLVKNWACLGHIS